MICKPKTTASGGAPAADAAEARQPPSRRHRLPYRRPSGWFLPLALGFMLLNYLAFGVQVDDKGENLVLPAYVRETAMQRNALRKAAATGETLAEPIPFNAFLFFEESVMGTLLQAGRFLCRSFFGIQVLCVLALLAHAFELGMCFRICYSCDASFPVMLLYMLCTCVGGFAQLSPLIKARDAWAREARPTARPKAKKNE
ncbi:hypothetical protein LSCM1_04687 [Leishmania martiniquensis]|uniref:Uncharacterized protein n=1 Tax=Leishmania martiniquensis TaxID=1580590 RepID=A0A836HK48_9TRYP|nr:hypothetical protein LSCM1_04687 [Leishmania martiniquensis]